MAKLIERTRGKSLIFEIRFYVGGQCKTIPLGKKYTPKTARELTGIVETLLRCKDNGVAILDKRTQVWIETATPEIREKLAKAGLIELPPFHTLKELWDSFLAEKDTMRKAGKMKDATLHLYTHVCKCSHSRSVTYGEPVPMRLNDAGAKTESRHGSATVFGFGRSITRRIWTTTSKRRRNGQLPQTRWRVQLQPVEKIAPPGTFHHFFHL